MDLASLIAPRLARRPRHGMLDAVLLALVALAAAFVHSAPAAPARAEELVLVLRALDESGAALAPSELELTATRQRGGMISVWGPKAEADDRGRLRIELGDEVPLVGGRLLITTTSRTQGARIELADLALGEHELGDVALAPPPLLVEGVVLGRDGEPAADARVLLEKRWMGLLDEPPTWNVTYVDGRTDAQGRFALRGWCETDELRVTASGHRLAPSMLEVRAGETHAELRLVPTGAIAGSARIAAACGVGAIEVHLLQDDWPKRGAFVQPDGSFLVDEIAAGTYSIHLRARNDAEPLLRVDDLVVRSGETLRDPRLEAVDLLARVRCHRVQVVAPAGVELSYFVFHVRAPGEEELRGYSALSEFEIATASPALELVIELPPYRTVRMSGVDGDRRLELRPGIPVRLEIEGGALVLPEGVEVLAKLEPVGAAHPRTPWTRGAIDARGTARLVAGEAGANRVLLDIQRGSDVYMLPHGLVDPPSIVVEDREAEQEATVRIDRDALAKIAEAVASGG